MMFLVQLNWLSFKTFIDTSEWLKMHENNVSHFKDILLLTDSSLWVHLSSVAWQYNWVCLQTQESIFIQINI